MKTKNYFSTNQTRKNVVGKSCFTLPLSPLPACLSLSLLFVSTCVYLGEAVVESPDPTRICEWAEGSFIYRRRPLQEGGVASSIYSSEVHQREGTTSSGGKPQNDACWQRHGASSLFWLAGAVSGPYPFGLFLATDSRACFGRTSVVLSNVIRQSSVWTILGPLIPVSSEEDFRW